MVLHRCLYLCATKEQTSELFFFETHAEYTIMFNPDGRYGPYTYYIGSPGSMPARFIAGNDVLDADNDNAYDLACV